MARNGFVDAVWVGPYGYAVVNGPALVPGETIVELTAGEAEESPNWAPIQTSHAPTKKELAEQATELGIDIPAGASKAAIAALIEAHEPEPQADPDPEPDPEPEPEQPAETESTD